MITNLKKTIYKKTPRFYNALRALRGTDQKNFRMRQQFCAELAERSQLSIWDVKQLAQPFISLMPVERNWWSQMYSNSSVFKKYVGLPEDYHMNVGIQHSSILNIPDDIENFYPEYTGYKRYFAIGYNVFSTLKSYGKDIYWTGSSFLYAESFLNIEEIEKEKEKIGKTLILYPIHNTELDKVNFDHENFIHDALKIKQQYKYETLIVSLSWRELDEYHINIYKKYDIKCICAGHSNDINFMSRHKSILQLSDAIFTNYLGSFIGYGLSLGKPFFHQEMTYEGRIEDSKLVNLISKKMNCSFSDIITNDGRISEGQKKMAEYYWGVGHKMSKNEILSLILNAPEFE